MSNIYIKPAVFSGHENVVCAVSTRYSGGSASPFFFNMSYKVGDEAGNVKRNREAFFGALGIDGGKVTYQQQTHSIRHNYVSEPSFFKDSDALFTDVPGLYLAVSIADCVPVFLYDPAKKVISAVHTGWRGTQAKILTETVLTLQKQFGVDCAGMYAYIGPSISKQNFEVGREVFELFREEARETRDGKYCVDLKTDNYLQLTELGFSTQNIEVSDYCTYGNPEMFHSYRRDGDKSGRMLGIIGMKEC